MTDIYNPFIERAGVAQLKSKKQPAIDARIEWIGKLSDWHKEYYANKDYWSLIALSYEYDKLKYMHKTAAFIRTEAAVMRQGVRE